MITKQNTTIGYVGKMVIGTGLAGVTALLIAAIALAGRPDMPGTAASLPASIRSIVGDLVHALGFGGNNTPMKSAPLGIDLPQGADVRDLPRGLSDYIRPGSAAPAVPSQPVQLGIDLPQGADVRDLPRGLTDYIRPSH